MSHAALKRAASASLVLALGAAAIAQGAAVVEVNNLILRADGGFTPRELPRRGYAPAAFEGFARIASRDGSRPSPLRQVVVWFDRDGRLALADLPTCAPETVADASVAEARRLCGGAIVGEGEVEAEISLSSGPLRARSPLTVFNGPRQNGRPTAIAHAQTTVPGTQTFAIVVPIEPAGGAYGYRARIDVPPIAAGFGSLTDVELEIGRRYRAGGVRRSYLSARCRDRVQKTRGRFVFEDGTLIEGFVEKPCRPILAHPGR